MNDSTSPLQPIRILFVCTGNTCRSPMAEVIARERIGRRGWSHVEVSSAGVAAWGGHPAADDAVRTADENGLDLRGHASRPLTAEDVRGVDLILAMTPDHLDAVRAQGAGDRVTLLSEAAGVGSLPVPDPIGQGVDVYRRTWSLLAEWIEAVLDTLGRERPS